MLARLSGAALALLAGMAPVLAQSDVYCNAPGRGYDANATQTFLDMAGRNDSSAVNYLSGTWYSQVASPDGRTSYSYYSYGPGGQYSYQQRVCSMDGFCSDFYGIGYWTAMAINQSQLSSMLIVSDQSRDHECGGAAIQILDANRFESGGVLFARQ